MVTTKPEPVATDDEASSPTQVRSAHRRSASVASVVVQRLALLALVLLAWEIAARLLDSRSIPNVTDVAAAAIDTVPTAQFWKALAGTLQSWAAGMGVAIAIGVPAGMVVGSNALATRMTRVVVEFMRTVPAIMIVPLAVLVLGATVEMKIFLISLAATWPILVHASYGIRDVDPVARDTATTFGLGRRHRILFLNVPSALPVIATGVRVAATVALLISVGAEIVTSAPGIGHEILLAQANRASDRAFVYVLLSGLLGVAINLTFAAIERRTLFWHASQRTRAAA